MTKYKAIQPISMNRITVFNVGDTFDGTEPTFIIGDTKKTKETTVKLNSEMVKKLNGIDALKIKVESDVKAWVQAEKIGETDTTKPAETKPLSVDVKTPVWVKAIPTVMAVGGAYFAYHRKSSVGGYIGWILLGGLIGTAIAIPLTAKYAFKGLIGEAGKQLKTDLVNKTTTSSSALSPADQKKWILDNAESIYAMDKTALATPLNKLTTNELKAFYVMGAAPSEFGKEVMSAPTKENVKKIQDKFGIDVSSAQFKAYIESAFTKLTS